MWASRGYFIGIDEILALLWLLADPDIVYLMIRLWQGPFSLRVCFQSTFGQNSPNYICHSLR